MSLSQIFAKKLNKQMKLLYIVQKRPTSIIRLDPITPEDYLVEIQSVGKWSEDNQRLYNLILQNGMAEFICNWPYLYEFYENLCFTELQINKIDQKSLRFTQLKELNLSQNSISRLENLPPSLKILYLDFNEVSEISLSQQHSLQLLSISHNKLQEKCIQNMTKYLPSLRILNLSFNKLQNTDAFIENVSSLELLKVLYFINNPISLLPHIFSLLNSKVPWLSSINGKSVNKQQAKPQILSNTVAKFKAKITNLQNFKGCTYDSSIFPAQTDPKIMQSQYYLKYSFMGKEETLIQKSVSYDTAVTQGTNNRINLNCQIQKQILPLESQLNEFLHGLLVQIYITQAKVHKDPQSGQLKPVLNNNQVQIIHQLIGGTIIDLKSLLVGDIKKIQYKYTLFQKDAYLSPLFLNPYENQKQLINKKKQALEAQLKKVQQERLKQLEEQQAQKAKKGGKDAKKGAEKATKKQTKKQGKQAVVEKKGCQPCNFPIYQRNYCVIEDKIYKGKQLLCLSALIS